MHKARVASHPQYARDLNTGAIVLDSKTTLDSYNAQKAERAKQLNREQEKDKQINEMKDKITRMQEQLDFIQKALSQKDRE